MFDGFDAPLFRAPWASHPCETPVHHVPEPLETDGHHVCPIEWQHRIWPTVDRDTPRTIRLREIAWLCSNCHRLVHIALDAIEHGIDPPAGVPKHLVELARLGYATFQAVRGVAGGDPSKR